MPRIYGSDSNNSNRKTNLKVFAAIFFIILGYALFALLCFDRIEYVKNDPANIEVKESLFVIGTLEKIYPVFKGPTVYKFNENLFIYHKDDSMIDKDLKEGQKVLLIFHKNNVYIRRFVNDP